MQEFSLTTAGLAKSILLISLIVGLIVAIIYYVRKNNWRQAQEDKPKNIFELRIQARKDAEEAVASYAAGFFLDKAVKGLSAMALREIISDETLPTSLRKAAEKEMASRPAVDRLLHDIFYPPEED